MTERSEQQSGAEKYRHLAINSFLISVFHSLLAVGPYILCAFFINNNAVFKISGEINVNVMIQQMFDSNSSSHFTLIITRGFPTLVCVLDNPSVFC